MKIIELKSSNIKRIKAVELKLDEKNNVVMITGRNGQGKTSILDSIWYALAGKKAIQDKPIRDGEEKGEIEVDVDGYIIKRTFTDKGSYLTVNNQEGAKYSNPQEFLDYIMGNLSFDPLEFSRLDNKKKIEELTKIVGLDINTFEQRKKELTQERLIIGREMKTIGVPNEENIAQALKLKGKEEVSVAELSKQVQEANTVHIAFIHAQSQIKIANDSIAAKQKQIEQLQNEIKKHEFDIAEQQNVKDTEVDVESLKKQIQNAEAENALIREAKNLLAINEKAMAKREEYTRLTGLIVVNEEEKKIKLAEAKMPIKGLSWEEDKVLYNNIPYEQISAAEQLRVSMAIAMASNPKLKVILIRDGSLLDKDNMKVIEEMARDKDFQVWIERVDDSGKVGIYIEDGEIKKINQ